LLVGTHGGGGRIYRVSLVEGGPAIFGDLNDDGAIDSEDWISLRDHFHADLTGLTPNAAYALGDLNHDFLNNSTDFSLFKNAYEEHHGAGAFADLLTAPEPSACLLATAASCGLMARRRRTTTFP
jgi:hypothetical protein